MLETGSAHQQKYPEFKNYGDLGGNFSLQSTLNRRVSLSDYKNSLVLIYFGFTSCIDICPVTLSVAAKSISRLKKTQQKKIKLFFVALDHERDSLTKLSHYLAQFDKNFIGLIGTEQELKEIVLLYGGSFFKTASKKTEKSNASKKNVPHYTINHTGYLYLLDNKQKIRALYRSDTTEIQLQAGLQKLFKETF